MQFNYRQWLYFCIKAVSERRLYTSQCRVVTLTLIWTLGKVAGNGWVDLSLQSKCEKNVTERDKCGCVVSISPGEQTSWPRIIQMLVHAAAITVQTTERILGHSWTSANTSQMLECKHWADFFFCICIIIVYYTGTCKSWLFIYETCLSSQRVFSHSHCGCFQRKSSKKPISAQRTHLETSWWIFSS